MHEYLLFVTYLVYSFCAAKRCPNVTGHQCKQSLTLKNRQHSYIEIQALLAPVHTKWKQKDQRTGKKDQTRNAFQHCAVLRFLLCLERLDADWLSSCVCLEGLHSDCFCCMWYCYHAFSLDECPFSPVGGRIFCCAYILIGWVVYSGLEKKDASMFEMVSNSFVISEINL